jgi:asparagine synthase (glutamine-hydrolysing)
MCGVAGIWDRNGTGGDPEAAVGRMTAALVRRGPDGVDHWCDRDAGLALGHCRLAILDLSAAGDQPMVSRDGRWVLVYNGEIYNAPEIAAELDVPLRGHCDSEVLLEACARWGVEATLPRLAGMFAFALWDRRERALWLARDRLGIKPLVYAWQGERLLFASDLTGLRAAPGFEARVDPMAVAGYLRRGCVPAPHTILEGARKLPPGHLLHVPVSGAARLSAWWSLDRLPAPGSGEAPDDLDGRLERLLDKVVRQHLASDVPLGAFLSGGIDSSLVVATMARVAAAPVHTFSIGFDDPAYDEASYAKAVAAYLGTEHTELILEPEHAREVIPLLPEVYDEPFADASQIPTFLVCRLARREVTVALSGDGGDEGFAGYTRYTAIRRLWRGAGALPPGLRGLGAGGLTALSPAAWNALGGGLPGRLRPRQLGDKLHKLARLLGERTVAGMYRQAISQWPDPSVLTRAPEPPLGLARPPDDPVAQLRWLDMLGYLPDDILTKLDRASMAVSLEARVPLLDHRVVEFAWGLPTSALISGGQGKQPLRRLLGRHLPAALFERPKMGFELPLGDWLRGPLRDWAEDLLGEPALASTGLLDPAPVRQVWQAHLGGRVNAQAQLWSVLMLQAWARRWRTAL